MRRSIKKVDLFGEAVLCMIVIGVLVHYYISIQNPMEKSDGAWMSLFKLTKNHKDTFFFVNVATSVGEATAILITVG